MPRHSVPKKFIPPLVTPRAYWSQDEVSAETLRMARLSQQQPPEQLEPQTQAKTAPTPKRKPKQPPPTVYKLVFNEQGEFVEMRRNIEKDAEPTTVVQRRLPPPHAR
jgi:hypothetical protein